MVDVLDQNRKGLVDKGAQSRLLVDWAGHAHLRTDRTETGHIALEALLLPAYESSVRILREVGLRLVACTACDRPRHLEGVRRGALCAGRQAGTYARTNTLADERHVRTHLNLVGKELLPAVWIRRDISVKL